MLETVALLWESVVGRAKFEPLLRCTEVVVPLRQLVVVVPLWHMAVGRAEVVVPLQHMVVGRAEAVVLLRHMVVGRAEVVAPLWHMAVGRAEVVAPLWYMAVGREEAVVPLRCTVVVVLLWHREVVALLWHREVAVPVFSSQPLSLLHISSSPLHLLSRSPAIIIY
jgi:hypothetical protein